MFSVNTLKYVGYVSHFGSQMGFIPYKCTSLQQEGSNDQPQFGFLLEQRVGIQWIFWRIYVAIGILFCLLKTVILIYFLQTTTASGQKKTLELFMVVAMTYGMMFHLNTVFYRDEIEAISNYVIKLNQKFMKDFKCQGLTDGLELYVKFYTAVTLLFLVSFYPFMYNRKSEIQNLYTYLGGTNEFYRLTYQVAELIIASSYFTLATFYNFLMVGSANSMLYWVDRLNKTQEIGKSMLESIELSFSHPVRFLFWKVVKYRQIGLINLLYYKSCGIFLVVVGLTYCCGLFILSSFVVIKYYEKLGMQGAGSVLIVAVMSQVMIIFCMKMDLSVEKSGMTLREVAFLRSVVRSLQPIDIHIGIFFLIKRSSTLTSIDLNLSYLIDLLLTYE